MRCFGSSPAVVEIGTVIVRLFAVGGDPGVPLGNSHDGGVIIRAIVDCGVN